MENKKQEVLEDEIKFKNYCIQKIEELGEEKRKELNEDEEKLNKFLWEVVNSYGKEVNNEENISSKITEDVDIEALAKSLDEKIAKLEEQERKANNEF